MHDLDGEGIQDANELGIEDADIKLKDANEVVIGTTTAAADGSYSFTDLQPGTYSVMFVQPNGFTQVSPLNAGTDDTIVSDADPMRAARRHSLSYQVG